MSVPHLRFKNDYGQDFPDWEEATLGEVCDIKRGASPRPIADKKWFSHDSTIGWVRISDVSKSSKYLTKTEQYLSEAGIKKSRLVKKGNIIMSICATIGKPIYTNFDVCIHDGFVVFENLQIDHEYLYYYLMLIEKNWYQYGQPGSQVNLNSDIVSNETIPTPDIKEQTKIANFLTIIDKKIIQLNQKHDLLTQYKKGVMQQIFSQELRFKDDDGRDFAEWGNGTLGDAFEYRNGKSFENEVSEDGEYFLVTLNSIDIAGKLKHDHKRVAKSDSSLITNDLVMILSDVAHGNFLGLTDVIPSDKYVLNQRIGGLRAKINLNVRFASLYINFNQKYFKLHGQGSSQLNLSKGDVLDFNLPQPHIKEQTKIANFLTAIDDKITATQTQLQAVKQYRQSLLQQMFV